MCIDIQCAVGWDDFGLFEIPQVALVQIDDFPKKMILAQKCPRATLLSLYY